jgi:hypothetical protein
MRADHPFVCRFVTVQSRQRSRGERARGPPGGAELLVAGSLTSLPYWPVADPDRAGRRGRIRCLPWVDGIRAASSRARLRPRRSIQVPGTAVPRAPRSRRHPSSVRPASRGGWALMLRTGWVVVLRTVLVSWSSRSMVMVSAATWTVTTWPTWIRPRAIAGSAQPTGLVPGQRAGPGAQQIIRFGTPRSPGRCPSGGAHPVETSDR